MQDEQALDVTQAARVKQVSPATIRRMCEAKLIPGAYPIGAGSQRRHWRIPRAGLSSVNPLKEDDFEAAIRAEETEDAEATKAAVTNTDGATGNTKARARA